jgi:hypothetical protein
MSNWTQIWLAFLLGGGLMWFWIATTERGWKRAGDIFFGSWILVQFITTLIEHYMEVPT